MLYCVIGSSVSVLGLVGNGLTVAVLWADINKSATIFQLLCLSIADSLVLLTYGTFTFLNTLTKFFGWKVASDNLRNFTYAYVGAVSNMALMSAIWLTVLVTWQRYINVCLPYRAKIIGTLHIAKIQSALVAAVAFIFNIPRFFKYQLYYNSPSPGMTRLVLTGLLSNDAYQVGYGVVLYYMLYYILPLSALAYMTAALIRALRSAQIKRERLTGGKNKEYNSMRELTVSLIIVVLIFIVCHFLAPIRRILLLYASDPSERACGTFFYYYNQYVIVALLGSSAINVIIYILCIKRFRVKLKTLCVYYLRMRRGDVMPMSVPGTSSGSDTNKTNNVRVKTTHTVVKSVTCGLPVVGEAWGEDA